MEEELGKIDRECVNELGKLNNYHQSFGQSFMDEHQGLINERKQRFESRFDSNKRIIRNLYQGNLDAELKCVYYGYFNNIEAEQVWFNILRQLNYKSLEHIFERISIDYALEYGTDAKKDLAKFIKIFL